ncbi:MAG: SdpI family protein [Clostridiales bacterium]|nr:SdpI family protein [Clostridiales bacterium]
MGFWIFMLCMVLMIPVIMIVFGWIFMKKAPGKVNWVFGYKTKRSMTNEDTWAFAHKYIGRLWWICGLVLLPLSVIPMLLLSGKDKDMVGNVGAFITMVQMIPLVGTIFPTERALKKNFDENGWPR